MLMVALLFNDLEVALCFSLKQRLLPQKFTFLAHLGKNKETLCNSSCQELDHSQSCQGDD